MAFGTSTMLLADVPVHLVAARVGHADSAVTPRIYVHVVD
ncbi:integrase [Actinomadura algeriensis]|uniref:Integrase n=1 Tax=Actinomadura algeriensis TaxID=1679523 RepID=A0ABR9JSW9_9ACTN|nr:integrase [Actinomadura algeriensis]